MVNETELERLRRLLELSEGPLEKILKQQALMDRMLQPESPTIRMLELMQHQSSAATLADQFEKLNRQSALFEATQSILTRPAMLEQMEALSKRADEMQRLTGNALLPDSLCVAAC